MGVLDTLDYDKSVDSKDEYEKKLRKDQRKLLEQQLKLRQEERSVILVFEGWDAAGKGGAIRRMTEQLDPRGYHVWPIGPPSEDERRHHYLWRFWKRLPDRGAIAVFDRSWYGRVLVERVEGLARKPEWKRAYREINEFERMLCDDGNILIKMFLAITKDEQLRRFKDRESNPLKYWKLGPEDWRNREKWDAYERAVCDMVDRTSTEPAPWHLVEANDKRWARVKILETVCDSIEKAL